MRVKLIPMLILLLQMILLPGFETPLERDAGEPDGDGSEIL
jgi:hypothetical protein